MSKTATAETKGPAWHFKPAWPSMIIRIREFAAKQGKDAEAMALQQFDTKLDDLNMWQSFGLHSQFMMVERAELLAREQASGDLGYCFDCGVWVGETSAQCGACKEGMVPQSSHRYDHSQSERMGYLLRHTKRERFIDYK